MGFFYYMDLWILSVGLVSWMFWIDSILGRLTGYTIPYQELGLLDLIFIGLKIGETDDIDMTMVWRRDGKKYISSPALVLMESCALSETFLTVLQHKTR